MKAAIVVALAAIVAWTGWAVLGRHSPPPSAEVAASPAAAPTPPRELAMRDGDVLFFNDTADRKYDRALRGSIRGFQERTEIELGIVLREQLPEATTIEDYAVDLVAANRLGQRFAGRSILFLWVQAERRFKIEVAYELEGVFPDSTVKRLEDGARTFMLSTMAFARRDFLVELLMTMGIHYLDYKTTGRLGEVLLPIDPNGFKLTAHLSGGAGIVGSGYAATAEAIAREVHRMTGPDAAAVSPHRDAQEVVRRYLASLAAGVGDPGAPFLTEGSRLYRVERPQSRGYLRRLSSYYEKAHPYRVVERDDYAAALFREDQLVRPILLRRGAGGLWYVDEAAAWSHFHQFEGTEGPVAKYHPSPFHFAWSAQARSQRSGPLYTNRAAAPAPGDPERGLAQRLARAEARLAAEPNDADQFVALAEILQFEMYWIGAAVPLYERALALAPRRMDIRWRLVDLYMNTTEIDKVEVLFRDIVARSGDRMAASYLQVIPRYYR